ncbi:single-stranded DNA-binding protein SsbA, partial [Streptococcus pneumoniae]
MLESRSVREGHTGGAYSAPTANYSAPTNSVLDFSRNENPFGATNPLDISDDDLPF